MTAAAPAVASAVKPGHPESRDREQERDRDRDDDARWARALPLPCRLTVEVALCEVKVGDFLGLRPGAVLASRWRITRDVPLRANGTLIGWGELESASSRLALRLTELG